MYVNQIKGERMGKPRLDILEEKSISPSHRFYKLLPEGKSKDVSDFFLLFGAYENMTMVSSSMSLRDACLCS